MFFGGAKKRQLNAEREAAYNNLKERSELLDDACGIGLWEAVLHNGDALSPKSVWTWSPEFRRLIGYASDAEFPNVVQSWSDRLYPDDVAATFAAFGSHLTDKSGKARYDVTYRLKVRNGSYRWFRATGGCRHSADGTTIRACGSLTDIHDAKSIEATQAEAARHGAEVVRILSKSCESLAEGHLDVRIGDEIGADQETLRRAFNQAVEQLRDVMQSVSLSSETMRSGTDEMSAAVDNLSRRTEQQAASLEETAAALDEITATVRKTAAGAAHARQAVGTAKKDAEQSGSVVRQAVEAMSGIEKSSQQIGQIIGVIDEIAFQTNLLALNAGVEAARAGDAGRGFAVVASEVRALAQRSAEAAKEIKALVTTSTHQVDQGVELVGQTGVALERIVAQVTEINGIVVEIANSAQEQATGLDQVNTAVNQMDQMTQQNAVMVEQTTAASHALSGEANELNQLISRFRLGEAEIVRAGVPALRHRGSALATRPAASLSSGGAKAAARTPKSSLMSRLAAAPRSAPAMKQIGRSGALPKAVPAAAEAGWEEF